jgi:hypothetical protein
MQIILQYVYCEIHTQAYFCCCVFYFYWCGLATKSKKHSSKNKLTLTESWWRGKREKKESRLLLACISWTKLIDHRGDIQTPPLLKKTGMGRTAQISSEARATPTPHHNSLEGQTVHISRKRRSNHGATLALSRLLMFEQQSI